MPVCNYDGEVIGVAQIINKRGGGNNHEFTETDLKVNIDKINAFIERLNIIFFKQTEQIYTFNLIFKLFRYSNGTLHFAVLGFKMHSYLKYQFWSTRKTR